VGTFFNWQFHFLLSFQYETRRQVSAHKNMKLFSQALKFFNFCLCRNPMVETQWYPFNPSLRIMQCKKMEKPYANINFVKKTNAYGGLSFFAGKSSGAVT
jgi:hypothetical protein